MASIFQRGKKGTWWIKYYVASHQVYHTLNTTNARVAQRIKRQIEGEEAKGELVAPSKTPLPELLEDYCRFMSTFRTPKSCSADVSVLRVFFGPICPPLELGTHVNHRFRDDQAKQLPDMMMRRHIRAKQLEDVTGAMIEDFITTRMCEDGISPKTANRTREVLHKLFNYAIKKWNFVAPDRRHPNPAALVQRRAEPPRVIRFLTAEQIDQQLTLLGDEQTIRVLVATYIYAGLRREEGLWLTRTDVDLDKRLIHVRAKTIGGEFWQPKTKRNRVVPIGDTLGDILTEYEPPTGCPWFFPSPRGCRWNPDNFSQTLREVNRENGLEWSCLDFRHTFGSHLAQKGVSLYKIAELMGNSPEICRRHYAALVPEKMHDVVEFGEVEKPSPTDAILQQVLAKLDQLPRDREAPQLRLAE
ncbi:MAG: tyrosine-type recombinase/integrase [Planctomycetota bacterium]